MKHRVDCLLVITLVLSGCAGVKTATDAGPMPERVDLVTLPLSESGREGLERVRRALADRDPDEAESQLRTVETTHRFHPDVLMLRAMLARRQGEHRDAIQALETLLGQKPADAAATNDLALLYRQQGRVDEAASLLERALDAHPEDPRLHYNLAVLSELYLLDLDRALTHYRRYQSLSDGKDEDVALWIRDLERRVE